MPEKITRTATCDDERNEEVRQRAIKLLQDKPTAFLLVLMTDDPVDSEGHDLSCQPPGSSAEIFQAALVAGQVAAKCMAQDVFSQLMGDDMPGSSEQRH